MGELRHWSTEARKIDTPDRSITDSFEETTYRVVYQVLLGDVLLSAYENESFTLLDN